jgi:hypothetical protein
MMNIAALLLSVLCLQDTKTIVRAEKGDYQEAVKKLREAEALVESDPQTAVDRLTDIIGNPKLRVMECIYKIELRPGDHEFHPFLPYKARGQARVNLAKKATPENAMKLLQGAVDDFEESVKRNVTPSGEPLKNAQAALAKLKADVVKQPDLVNPVARFREKWEPLMRANRFKAAKAVLTDKESAEGLTDEQKKGFLTSTEQGCRELLTRWVSDFRPQFVSAISQGLEQKTPDEFDLLFALPAPDELILSHPVLDWARQHQPAFRDVQTQKQPPHSLAAAAVAAAPLDEQLNSPYFRAVEQVVFTSLKNAITVEVDKSRDATKTDRDKARALADALLSQWKAFAGKLDAKFAERHRLADREKQLVKLFDGFPAELADLAKIDPAVEAAFSAEAPDADLGKIEESLSNLESRGNLTRESRQQIYTLRVTVGALRGLFNGKSEDAVAADLSAVGLKLKEAGGPAGDVKKYGPRVEKVFAALLR